MYSIYIYIYMYEDILLPFFIWSIITMQVRCEQGCRKGPFPYSPHLCQTMMGSRTGTSNKESDILRNSGSHWYWGYNGHLASRCIYIYTYTYFYTYIYIYTFVTSIYLYIYMYIYIYYTCIHVNTSQITCQLPGSPHQAPGRLRKVDLQSASDRASLLMGQINTRGRYHKPHVPWKRNDLDGRMFSYMGMSENVGLIFPMIFSHLVGVPMIFSHFWLG